MGGGGTLGMGATPSGGLPWVMFQYICWLLIVQSHSQRYHFSLVEVNQAIISL